MIWLGSSSGKTHTTPRCNAQPGAKGLGQPRWTLTVLTSHLPRKPLWNPRKWTSWQLGLGPRKHTGRKLWTRRSAHGLTGSCYWLGQQSPSGRNTASSRGNYGAGSSIWYTDLDASRASLRLTPWTSQHRTLASWTP